MGAIDPYRWTAGSTRLDSFDPVSTHRGEPRGTGPTGTSARIRRRFQVVLIAVAFAAGLLAPPASAAAAAPYSISGTVTDSHGAGDAGIQARYTSVGRSVRTVLSATLAVRVKSATAGAQRWPPNREGPEKPAGSRWTSQQQPRSSGGDDGARLGPAATTSSRVRQIQPGDREQS